MKDQFVPYESAVKLKELGFNEPCLAFYDCSKAFTYSPNNSKIYTIKILAPLWQQVFDWFRNRKGFESFIRFRHGYGNTSHSFYICDIFSQSGKSVYLGEGTTYEEARRACLEKLIELASDGKR